MEFISRQQATSDELPPWAGIVFKDPIDSDALSEKLRTRYPECQTHRERKHQAAIDFLTDELRRMRTKTAIDTVSTNDSSFPANRSRCDSHTPLVEVLSECGDVSILSSCTTPQIIDASTSPKLGEQAVDCSRTPDTKGKHLKTDSANTQHYVWSAHDGRPMQPKTKRKMTLEERSAYKETRKRGACERCRRQKGKCTHLNESGELNTSTADQSPKRRRSTNRDVIHELSPKTIKIEDECDVRHEPGNRVSFDRQLGNSSRGSPIASFHALNIDTQAKHEPEAKYVLSPNFIGQFGNQSSQFPEPWNIFSATNPTAPIYPAYPPGTVPSNPSPQDGYVGDFSFNSDMAFFDDPWNPNLGEPNTAPPPG